jgi:mannose-6-phosphate isomerase-like protein (cupin superfamily)
MIHHFNFEIGSSNFVVVQGKYTVIIDGKEEPLRAGQECYIPKGTLHSGRATFIASISSEQKRQASFALWAIIMGKVQ